MNFRMSLTMNELFNYEHTQSVESCTPEKETFKRRHESNGWEQGKSRAQVATNLAEHDGSNFEARNKEPTSLS